MKKTAAALVLISSIVLSGQAWGQPLDPISKRVVSWMSTQELALEGSYSGVFFDDDIYEDFFDRDYLPLVRFGSALYLLPNLSLGSNVGGIYDAAEAVGSISGDRSGENVEFYVFPMQIELRYRFLFMEDQPIVPFIYGGGDYWYFEERSDIDDVEGDKTGYHYGGDLAFLLDLLDPRSARQMKKYWNVENTYLCLGYTYQEMGEDGDGLDFSGYALSLSLRFETPGQ